MACTHRRTSARLPGGDDGVEYRYSGSPTGQPAPRRSARGWIASRGDVLRAIEVADAAGDQLVQLDRSQFGPVKRGSAFSSRAFGDAAAWPLCSRLVADVRIAPEVAEAEAHQRPLLQDRQRRCSARPVSGLGTRDLDVISDSWGPWRSRPARRWCMPGRLRRRPPRTGTSRTRWM
jgi:hypothetical protein